MLTFALSWNQIAPTWTGPRVLCIRFIRHIFRWKKDWSINSTKQTELLSPSFLFYLDYIAMHALRRALSQYFCISRRQQSLDTLPNSPKWTISSEKNLWLFLKRIPKISKDKSCSTFLGKELFHEHDECRTSSQWCVPTHNQNLNVVLNRIF